jgi:hypothetical protein
LLLRYRPVFFHRNRRLLELHHGHRLVVEVDAHARGEDLAADLSDARTDLFAVLGELDIVLFEVKDHSYAVPLSTGLIGSTAMPFDW